MSESGRIINNSCRMAIYHGTTTADVVDEILDKTGGQVMCGGYLREFVFTPITKKTFKFKTQGWYGNR